MIKRVPHREYLRAAENLDLVFCRYLMALGSSASRCATLALAPLRHHFAFGSNAK
jgi:hypothetical protein